MSAHNLKDLTGQLFGRWRVVNRADNAPNGKAVWNCECSCGTRAKIAAKGRGRKPSDAARTAMSAARRGRKFSPETIAKRVAAYKATCANRLRAAMALEHRRDALELLS